MYGIQSKAMGILGNYFCETDIANCMCTHLRIASTWRQILKIGAPIFATKDAGAVILRGLTTEGRKEIPINKKTSCIPNKTHG